MGIQSYGAQSDDQLETLATGGDRLAFAELYNRHFDRVHDFAFRMLRDGDQAADVTQDSFLKAMAALKPTKQRASFSTFVFTIARNRCLNVIRNDKRRKPTAQPDPADDPASFTVVDERRFASPQEALQAKDLVGLVWEAAAALNPKDYSVLDLHLRHEMGADEIATALGTTRNNAYVMLSRLRSSLEKSVSALMLARRKREQCRELDALLSGRSPVFDADSQKVVLRHLDGCASCQEQRKQLVSPSALFGALALIPAPLGVKQTGLAQAMAQWGTAAAVTAGVASPVLIATKPFRALFGGAKQAGLLAGWKGAALITAGVITVAGGAGGGAVVLSGGFGSGRDGADSSAVAAHERSGTDRSSVAVLAEGATPEPEGGAGDASPEASAGPGSSQADGSGPGSDGIIAPTRPGATPAPGNTQTPIGNTPKPPAGTATPTPVPSGGGIFGTVITGQIGVGETDSYTFTGRIGDSVLLRVIPTSGSLVVHGGGLRIYQPPDGSKLCDNGAAWNEITCTLGRAGTHTILVTDTNGTGSGTYNLHLQRLNNPLGCTSLQFGATLSGSIASTAQINCYSFSGSIGDSVLLRVIPTSGSLVVHGGGLRIYQPPDGSKLCDNGAAWNEITCTLGQAGTHTILVTDTNGTGSGTYNLHLQRLNNPLGCTSLQFGATLSGSIASAAQINCYSFSGSIGDSVLLRVIPTSGSLVVHGGGLRIYQPPDGSKLCDNGAAWNEITCTLGRAGTHTILVTDTNGTGTGGYTISLQRTNP